MEWLNYHHLLYFWIVTRTGSIVAASKELRLAPPTISNQIHQLEENLGERLFERTGHKLVLTDAGRLAARYAEDIFTLGQEFTATLRERPDSRPLRLCVGISDVLPKTIAYELIRPALSLSVPIHLVCKEGRPDHLLADLGLHEIDVALFDAPASSSASHLRASSHLLLESGVTFFAQPQLSALIKRFPRSLNGAPFFLPLENTTLRRDLEAWFHRHHLQPHVIGEFADLALLRVFALREAGVFAGPTMMESRFLQDGFHRIGETKEITMRFYAISVERQVRNPAVVAICQTVHQGKISLH